MSSYFLDTLNCCKVNWNYFYQESWNSKQIICLSRSLTLSFSLSISPSLSVQVEVRVRVWGLWRFRFDSSCSKVAICSQKPVWPSLFKLLPPSPSVCVCWCVLVCVRAHVCGQMSAFFYVHALSNFSIVHIVLRSCNSGRKKEGKKKQNHISAWNLTLQKLWAAVAWWHQCTHVCTYSMSVYSRRIAIITLGNQIQRAEKRLQNKDCRDLSSSLN